MKRLKYLICLFITCCTIVVFAQTSNLKFRYITVNDGFKRSAILKAFQDKKGLMWFGAWDGLYRYDGRVLKKVPLDTDLNNFSNVKQIVEDNDECLWILCGDRILIWNMATHITIKLSLPTNIRLGATDLCQDIYGNMWIGTRDGFLYRYSRGHKNPTFEISTSSKINNIHATNNGNLWVATENGVGVVENCNRLCKYRNIFSLNILSSFDVTSITKIFQDSQKGLWLGTDKQIFRIHNTQSEKPAIQGIVCPSEKVPVEKIQINNFAESEDRIYAATNLGLFLFDKKNNTEQWIMPRYDQIDCLNDKNITDVLVDREQGLWLTTFYGGVNYMPSTINNFNSFSIISKNIKGHVVSGISEDELGNLWFSTEDEGVFVLEKETGNWINLFEYDYNGSIKSKNIQSIYAWGNYVYAGTFSEGMNVININNYKIEHINSQNTFPDKLPMSIYSFMPKDENHLMIGTIGGLYMLNIHNRETHRIKPIYGRVNCIEKDKKGNFWIGSNYDGLYILSSDLKLIRHFIQRTDNTKGFCSDKINAIAVFDTIAYVGTDNKGLWSYSFKHKYFSRVSSGIGENDVIYRILSYNEGRDLWITTNQGLYNLNRLSGKTIKYTVLDGLSSNQFKIGSGIQMKDGTILLGSLKGIDAFRPNELVHNTVPPQVVLVDFYIANKLVDIHEKDAPIRKDISTLKKIELKQEDNSFTFRFASSSYNNLEKNVFEYKLVPFDKEWRTALDRSNFASYTNLPAGNYTFCVRSHNGEGVWGKETSIDVLIHPYWWMTWPMKLLYFVLMVGSIFFGVYRYLRKKRKELYLYHLEKEKELFVSKMEFFTFMIHELRTPLTLILGPLSEIMHQKEKKVKETMDTLLTIEKNGKRLLYLANQLMDYRKIEEQSYPIHIETINIKEQILQTSEYFQYQFKDMEISFSVELPEEDACWVKADREAVNKIIVNLISNAVKFTKDRVEIRLRLSNDRLFWILSVTDNGPGMTQEEQTRIFESFYQVKRNQTSDYIGAGIGLSLVKKLTALLYGTIKVNSVLGKGSDFVFSIPVASAPKCQTVDDMQNCLANTEDKEQLEDDLLQDGPAVVSLQKNLLIVEDNADMRKFLRSVFATSYQVDCVENGQEALEATRNKGYDMIITDWMMPVMDGITLCKKLKNQLTTSHIPVLILTAKDDTESQYLGFYSDADAYVTKPFTPEVLLAQVHSIVKNRTLGHQHFYSEPEEMNDCLVKTEADRDFLKKLDQIIYERIAESSINVDEVAAALALGRTVFYQKVKALSGQTPNDYIRTLRLKKAVQLMKQGERRINEVYYQVGFTSSSYFAKKFSAQFGLSPSEYLKTLEQQNEDTTD